MPLSHLGSPTDTYALVQTALTFRIFGEDSLKKKSVLIFTWAKSTYLGRGTDATITDKLTPILVPTDEASSVFYALGSILSPPRSR